MKKVAILGAMAVLLATWLPATQAVAATTTITRVSGIDRYQVAANVSKTFKSNGTVFIASGEVFPDALSGGPAAGAIGGTVLLVNAGAIPAATKSELDRLKPSSIVVLGGSGSVSDAVLTQLGSWAPTSRIGGADRYAVAAGVSARFFASAPAVVVAAGGGFADALSAGAAAAHVQGPLLLAQADALPAVTASELTRLAPATVHVVGGVSSVSEAVVSAIKAATGATVIRHAGADRYAVSAGLAESLWPGGATSVYLAGGSTFADGLAATPAAAAAQAPLVLSAATCMPDATVATIAKLGAANEIYVGGPATLTTAHQNCSTPASQQKAVYVVPHQDDELISMVGGITADIKAGRDVWVVKINRGDFTGVYAQLCTDFGYCLTREEFGKARDREFVESAVAMGVAADHVILNSVIEQDPGYEATVDAVMEGLVQRFGRDAFFNAISFLDLHQSHAPVGYALKYRCESELVSRCSFFQSPLYQPGSAIATNPVAAPAPTWVTASASVVTKAVAAYKKWDPANGRYAIGWKSVSSQLTHTNNHPGSLMHLDTRYYNEAQRTAAQAWIDANQDPAWWTFGAP